VIGTTAIGNRDYVGRFAPSPTGPLHFGSLLAAVASYLEARQNNGRWLIRIDDIDPPRAQVGANEMILTALEAYGFEWDGPVIYQSESEPLHRRAIQELLDKGIAYRCGCSRRDLADAPRGSLGTIYPGNCRTGTTATDVAIRVRTSNEAIEFDDGLQGPQSQQLESESGDFVILRRDNLIAYQLAVAVDDDLEGVTDIVRGLDLMDSTARQICLQKYLGLKTPRYQHIPVAVHPDGSKLSKLTGAPGIPIDSAGRVLFDALNALLQDPPVELSDATLPEIWSWAKANWQINRLRGLTVIPTNRQAMAEPENPIR
jgi:glutamyl-Q tRNA(Asp) synthetase